VATASGYGRGTVAPRHDLATDGRFREAGDSFLPGSARWQIAAELNPEADDVLIDKITMSAFTGTFLDIALRDAQIESFIIAGIALEVGIEPTVRHGADLNYIPIVVTDACGSMTRELKDATLHSFETTGEIIFVTTAQITSLMTHNGKK
jgi:nicotinamidase-related amidase